MLAQPLGGGEAASLLRHLGDLREPSQVPPLLALSPSVARAERKEAIGAVPREDEPDLVRFSEVTRQSTVTVVAGQQGRRCVVERGGRVDLAQRLTGEDVVRQLE